MSNQYQWQLSHCYHQGGITAKAYILIFIWIWIVRVGRSTEMRKKMCRTSLDCRENDSPSGCYHNKRFVFTCYNLTVTKSLHSNCLLIKTKLFHFSSISLKVKELWYSNVQTYSFPSSISSVYQSNISSSFPISVQIQSDNLCTIIFL